jgi:hypothetical protein
MMTVGASAIPTFCVLRQNRRTEESAALHWLASRGNQVWQYAEDTVITAISPAIILYANRISVQRHLFNVSAVVAIARQDLL